jgi:hypothetical protein
MKHQIVAVLVGSAVALPAFANNEIDAGNLPAPVASSKSRAQVHDEIVAAQRSGDWRVNSRLGTVNPLARPAQFAGKSRAEVRAEVAQAQAAGDYIVNAELGTTANQL